MSRLSPFEAAVQYHVNCERFDRVICTGPMGKDGILPANGWEQQKINTNAQHEFARACKAAELPSGDMHVFIVDNHVHDEAQRRLIQGDGKASPATPGESDSQGGENA